MVKKDVKILIVDDDPINIQIIQEYLENENCHIKSCLSGEEALAFLADSGYGIDVILLDRMMAGMDGLEVLVELKKDSSLRHIPVIIQSALAHASEILKGVRAGAFYYLTKPFHEKELVSVVQTAIKDSLQFREIHALLSAPSQASKVLFSGSFQFKTVMDANALAGLLARNYPDPHRVVSGIRALFLNAVEHGNLGISYGEKTLLYDSGQFNSEVERRQILPEYRDKQVDVDVVSTDTEITLTIKDQGAGFNWQEYMDVSPERSMDNHGRSIAMAKIMSFDSLVYEGSGDCVVARVVT